MDPPVAFPPLLQGCFRQVDLQTSDMSSGERVPRGLTFVPALLLDSMEDALSEDNGPTWHQLQEDATRRALLQMTPSHGSRSEPFASGCPWLLPALHLTQGFALFRLASDRCRPAARQAFARALRVTSGQAEGYEQLAERWPRLQRLPQALWEGCTEGRCSGLGGSTLSSLLREPQGPGMRCLANDGAGLKAFDAEAFFGRGRRADVSPGALFRALYDDFSFRPAPFSSPCQHEMLQSVLEEHLDSLAAVQGGLHLEFGVAQGASANLIARHLESLWLRAGGTGPLPRLLGFDSFQGLPRAWKRMAQGSFAVAQGLPEVRKNVGLVPGWFNDTVEPFLRGVREAAAAVGGATPKVRFAHLDADLYESTKAVLDGLTPFFDDGTVLVFDDLLDLPSGDGPRTKENWNALWEMLRSPAWRWRLEVLAAPWHLQRTHLEVFCSAAAFRLVGGTS